MLIKRYGTSSHRPGQLESQTSTFKMEWGNAQGPRRTCHQRLVSDELCEFLWCEGSCSRRIRKQRCLANHLASCPPIFLFSLSWKIIFYLFTFTWFTLCSSPVNSLKNPLPFVHKSIQTLAQLCKNLRTPTPYGHFYRWKHEPYTMKFKL